MSEITMCVIDDVITVIDGILRKIDWAKHGIAIAGTAVNGREGLRLIREKRPDIVLTDIRMPFGSGIDMVRELRNRGESPGKVIFFSGYSDFAYAQESVRLGAFDYVLKPFTVEQIEDVVLRAKVRIEAERAEQLDRLALERKLRESLPYLRQEYFRLLIRHEELPERAADKWEFLGIDMEPRGFVAIAAQIDGWKEGSPPMPVSEVELSRFAVQNIMEETIDRQAKGIVFREHLEQFVILINAVEHSDALALAEACRDNVSRFAKRDISIGVGGLAEAIGDIAMSYGQARTALSYQFYFGGGSVISYRDIERQVGMTPHYSPDKETELLYCLRSGNREGVERLLDGIFDECLKYPAPPDPEIMANLFYGLAFAMYRVIAEKAGPEQRQWLDERLAAMKRGRYSSTGELIGDVKELGLTGCEWLLKRQKSDAGQLIHQAINYASGRLGSDLTVQECAAAVHLSPSYFSNLFKKEIGMTFMQYVTNARMEAAKKLLLEGMQVQDITFELGYRDRPYFSELFKKHTGMTPTEFRSKYVGGAAD
ncbi:response regulator transcription factor [Paenibacillus arenilitoris]|uniref:Helix-turn-helix domain-containing protein n=1 Tax=Paenibacillus arenilitoris TaxID=2772299 RepID=A0A927CK91_9BACL|nr:helix-turn-helix domain-containing protein [Paenibacillus arenilitoris]MBD2867220.1 helix-turn-helix domain-containing protein [Paenibacillus arenilitoris]